MNDLFNHKLDELLDACQEVQTICHEVQELCDQYIRQFGEL